MRDIPKVVLFLKRILKQVIKPVEKTKKKEIFHVRVSDMK